MSYRNETSDGCAFLSLIIWAIMIITWIINLVKLFNCDFDTPFKEEIIHLIGVFIFPASIITCWF